MPRSFRLNPFYHNPILTKRDLSRGVYDLVNQRIIPNKVDLD